MDGKSQSLQSNLDNQKYKSMSTNHSPEIEVEKSAGECYGSSPSMPAYHSVEFADGSPQSFFQREAVHRLNRLLLLLPIGRPRGGESSGGVSPTQPCSTTAPPRTSRVRPPPSPRTASSCGPTAPPRRAHRLPRRRPLRRRRRRIRPRRRRSPWRGTGAPW